MNTISGKKLKKEYPNAIFVKILRRDMCHRNFHYKIGLNMIDIFSHKNECSEGGLYFTTIKYIHLWSSFGDDLYLIEIPDDAIVLILENKFKANKFILTDVCYKNFSKLISPSLFLECVTKDGFKKGVQEYDYFIENVNEMPTKYYSTNFWEEYFNYTRDVNKIKYFYRTQRMYEITFNQTKDIYYIPQKFRNQYIYTKMFDEHKDINSIPENFRTAEMYVENYRITKEISIVPENLQCILLWYLWYLQNKSELPKIPKKFVTLGMKMNFFKHYPTFDNYPESEQQLLWEYHYKVFKNLSLIPEKFRNQNIWISYYCKTNDVSNIPVKFRTRNLWKKYFEKTKDLELIEKRYQKQMRKIEK